MSWDKFKETGIFENLDNPSTDDWSGDIDTDFIDTKLSEYEKLQDEEKIPQQARKIKNNVESHNGRFAMNTRATLEFKIEHAEEDRKKDLLSEVDSAVGGIDGHRAHLKGVGAEFWLMSSSKGRASGRFALKERPEDDLEKRQENVQAPPGNDCSVVEKIQSNKPVVVFESKIAPQPKWAKEAGYQAKEGVNQIYTPTLDEKKPMEKGTYSVVNEKRNLT